MDYANLNPRAMMSLLLSGFMINFSCSLCLEWICAQGCLFRSVFEPRTTPAGCAVPPGDSPEQLLCALRAGGAGHKVGAFEAIHGSAGGAEGGVRWAGRGGHKHPTACNPPQTELPFPHHSKVTLSVLSGTP